MCLIMGNKCLGSIGDIFYSQMMMIPFNRLRSHHPMIHVDDMFRF